MYCTYKYVFSPYKPIYRIHTCTYIRMYTFAAFGMHH